MRGKVRSLVKDTGKVFNVLEELENLRYEGKDLVWCSGF
jgi:hypothetical protein